jgi:multidrug resistance efflux pump
MRPTILAFGVVLLLGACGRRGHDGTLSGTIEWPDVEVGSLVGGRVLRVAKQEGEEAAAGDTIVELDPAEWQSNLDEARALADVTRRELDLLRAGPRPEEIAGARAEAKRGELLWQVSAKGSRPEDVEGARAEQRAAEARRTEAETEVERLQGLPRGVEARSRLDQAIADRDTTRAQVEVAKQRVALLEKGLRPEEVEAARQAWLAQLERVKALESGSRREEIAAKAATLEAAEARIRLAETRLRELKIVAPAACVVQTLDLRPGDIVRAGDRVAVLLLKDAPWVVVYVPESDLARVRLDQKARVTPDGHAALEGRVVWISRRAEYTPRNVQTREERVTQVFAMKVVLKGDTSRLKDGMWADVVVE